MPTLLDYRRRIRSVKNTQQITRAMKFIAAARLRKAHDAVLGARPYAREILRILRSAVARMEDPSRIRCSSAAKKQRILAVLLSGDRGLAGPFNANVIRFSLSFLRETFDPSKFRSWPSAARAATPSASADSTLAGDYLHVSLNVNFNHAKEIGARIIELY